MRGRAPAAGFTLLEVVVATSLLAGVLFTMGVLIPRCVLHIRNYGFQARAVQLADQLLEEIRGMDSTDVPHPTAGPVIYDGASAAPASTLAGHAFPPPPFPAAEATVTSQDQAQTVRYRFAVALSPVAGDATSRPLEQVTVTVSWDEPRGAETVQRYESVVSYVP